MSPFISRIPDEPPRKPMLVVVDRWTRLATYNAGNEVRRRLVVADFSFADTQPPPTPDNFELVPDEREGNS